MSDVGSGIDKMVKLLSHVLSLSDKIGGSGDSRQLREQIFGDVQALHTAGQQVKSIFLALSNQRASVLTSSIERYDALRARIQHELPKVIQRLRATLSASTAESALRVPLMMDQGLLDGQTEQIDVLEQTVNQIIAGMREVNQLFINPTRKIQSEREIITQIGSATGDSVSEMQLRDESLVCVIRREKSRKCICWTAIILVIVVVVTGLIILSQTIWKSDLATPAPPTGAYELSAK
jgi:flagellar basal body-associated protein FliL